LPEQSDGGPASVAAEPQKHRGSLLLQQREERFSAGHQQRRLRRDGHHSILPSIFDPTKDLHNLCHAARLQHPKSFDRVNGGGYGAVRHAGGGSDGLDCRRRAHRNCAGIGR